MICQKVYNLNRYCLNLKDKGLFLDDSSEEAYAYLLQSFVREMK